MASTIEVSLVVLATLLAVASLRRSSAALRHWVLAAGIVCAAVVPALGPIVPAWRLPIHLRASDGRSARPVEPSAARATNRETPGGISISATAGAAAPPSTLRATRLIRRIWMAGAAIGVGMLLIGLARLAWLASRSERVVDGTWRRTADDVSREYGLRRPVLLLQSRHPTMLVTWGVVRPRVILPAAAPGWTEERARVVLRHEIGHVKRHDWLMQIAAELLRAIYWFNPLLWIACSRLRLESEQACDDAVLSLGVGGPQYAEHLLDLARTFSTHQQRTWSSAPAIAHPSTLERRISAMLNARLNRAPLTRSARTAAAVALIGITVAIAGFGASAQTASATLSGSVADPHGVFLPDAAVVLTNARNSEKRTAQTNQAGQFVLADVPAGEYVLDVGVPGFARLRENVTIGAGRNVQRDLALKLGTVRETINVGAGAPTVKALDPSQLEKALAQRRGQSLQPPLKVRDVRPVYGESLRAARFEGSVVMEGLIGVDGSIRDLRVVPPANADAAKAALEAVRQWKFEPTRLNGKPVDTNITITVNFTPHTIDVKIKPQE